MARSAYLVPEPTTSVSAAMRETSEAGRPLSCCSWKRCMKVPSLGNAFMPRAASVSAALSSALPLLGSGLCTHTSHLAEVARSCVKQSSCASASPAGLCTSGMHLLAYGARTRALQR